MRDSDLYFELQQFYARQMQSLDGGDAAAFADSFTPDGIFIHYPDSKVCGRDSIRSATQEGIERTRGTGVVRRHWFGLLDVQRQADGTVHTSYSAYTTAVDAAGAVRIGPTCLVEDILVPDGAGGFLNHTRAIRRDDHERRPMSDTRVALVTGSSAGIGATIASTLADAGYRVVVNSARSVEAGAAVAAKLPDAVYLQADIADPEQAHRLVAETVERLGRLDLLVNNAGTTRAIPHGDLDAVTPEVWRSILDVNLLGTWEMIKAAVPHLRAGGSGSIVNISSIAGSRPAGSSIPYAVSKAAIEHLTRLLAATLGPDVRVNAVAPGLIDTEWTASFTEPRAWMETVSPMRRVGRTSDVAAMVLALAEATFTTGEVVLVDGGTHLR